MSIPEPPPTPAERTAPIIARASKTVRNKNLLIVGMCAVFACWFAYDGWIGWPGRNDQLAENQLAVRIHDDPLYTQFQPLIDSWHGWNNADSDTRMKITAIAHNLNLEGWKSETDIHNQQYIVYGLLAATVGAIGWFVHCQRRRAIAEGGTVSPLPGVVIPWEKITVVDNTRWKSMGIVQITYD